MDAQTLKTEIAKVCPVLWTTVLVPDDRTTWSYGAAADATPAEKAAGDNVVATIPVAVPGQASTPEFISRWTNAEYRALQDRRMADNGKTGKDWDNITSEPLIDMSRTKVKNLEADLVAAGVLTQARADVIFS